MAALERQLRKNQILAALSDREYKRLSSHLEIVELAHAEVLYEMGGPITDVYFPFDAVVSLVMEMTDGKIVEVGLVGNEGMTGITALMGHETSAERAIVQIPNGGVRAKLSVIKEEFNRGGELQAVLLSYTQKLMRQVAQTAACNATHTAEERLARWLLMCHDRVDSKELNLTQEFIAEMLGTRRATVSQAAMVLQTEGLIHYNRGRIKVVDRERLESVACECYRAVRGSG
jgi:CRP-like cAMP-binding protein